MIQVTIYNYLYLCKYTTFYKKECNQTVQSLVCGENCQMSPKDSSEFEMLNITFILSNYPPTTIMQSLYTKDEHAWREHGIFSDSLLFNSMNDRGVWG